MKDINAATKWYKGSQPLFESLASKVADVVEENIEGRGVEYHDISSRGKSLKSFIAKANKEKYTDPVNQIKDMAGVRVTTYLESDVSKIARIVERLFDIDRPNSVDQSQLLGSNRVGYRGVHYVATFKRSRCKLPEYKKYEGLPFEIQIRSLLQHAWAEIEHDRNYKFGGKLPSELERRFYVLAGALESADREFVAIADAIEKYKVGVKHGLRKGDLNIEINTTSLTEYLSSKFRKLIVNIPQPSGWTADETLTKTIVEELELFGISTLDQLEKIVPKDLEHNLMASDYKGWSFVGLIRVILMISNVERYFQSCWRKAWGAIDEKAVNVMANYGVDITHLEKYVEFEPETVP